MKLISLNIWGGHVHEPLLDFIRTHKDVDIFCLQEVYHNAKEKISTDDLPVSLNILSELQALLPSHKPFFRPVVGGIYGIAMFVKEGIEILEEGQMAIHHNPTYIGRGPTHSRNLQWTKCQMGEKNYTIINVHGLWNGRGKSDAPERIVQSHNIKAFLDQAPNPKILCGDLNLRPDTESLKIVGTGMKNLIEQFKIQSTRTNLYKKEERFADYVFTSPEIKVNHFEVMKDEVSDHSPLLLDFL